VSRHAQGPHCVPKVSALAQFVLGSPAPVTLIIDVHLTSASVTG